MFANPPVPIFPPTPLNYYMPQFQKKAAVSESESSSGDSFK
jgi:hypothetical protein